MRIVCIVHYNTQQLTAAAIRSLEKHTPGAYIFVFDNSDRTPFDPAGIDADIEILDNTEGQLIDFDRRLACFPDKVPVANGYASAKHCMSVQWMFDHLDDEFLLMDSDVLVRRDISPLWDTRKAWVGHVHNHHSRFGNVDRVHPCLCFFNLPVLHANRVTYFNPDKMYALSNRRPDNAYDTGCWFYEDCRAKGLQGADIPDLERYILHLGHGSWKRNKMASASQWLDDNRELWKIED